MGFFKDFKDDLSQAVNDLLPADASKDTKKDVTQNSSVDQNTSAPQNVSIPQNISESQNGLNVDSETAVANEVVDMYDEEDNIDRDLLDAILTNESTEEKYGEENQVEVDLVDEINGNIEEVVHDESVNQTNLNYNSNDNQSVASKIEDKIEEEVNISVDSKREEIRSNESNPKANSDEVTIIAKGTTINGNISSDCSLEIMGTIKGDVDCQGKLSIIGSVSGTCNASEVYVASNRLEGCINSVGSVKIGLGTIVIGDIAGTSAVIAGAVKGNIDVNGPVIVDSSAVIKGNIKAQTIQINHGAIIDGYCSTSYTSVDIDNLFE